MLLSAKLIILSAASIGLVVTLVPVIQYDYLWRHPPVKLVDVCNLLIAALCTYIVLIVFISISSLLPIKDKFVLLTYFFLGLLATCLEVAGYILIAYPNYRHLSLPTIREWMFGGIFVALPLLFGTILIAAYDVYGLVEQYD
ncbi:hypothetical protein CSKR_104538 [Clonorchis sinensis]|uniref:Uncharacterized protein n=1 Tax=Clonorchis sinensis TaxID=79923 RepID=A0A3R7FLN6_CLOSI|nr:hypothetical protein CSKR_104538 [Clonorchis sinensis]